MTELDPELAKDAALAMNIVKHEANDSVGTDTWTVDRGGARFLEVLASRGWRVVRASDDPSMATSMAPEADRT